MGPGPSDVPQRILDAMQRPTIGHLDPAFQDMMEQIKSLLRYSFQTSNALTFPVSASGSAGMEMCFVNLVEPGDKVLVCINGVIGGRMLENVKRSSGVSVVVDEWGKDAAYSGSQKCLSCTPGISPVTFSDRAIANISDFTEAGRMSAVFVVRSQPRLAFHLQQRHYLAAVRICV
jgi:alanine-glyoxylate transaminase / serine-glyoxylate transaminase / serine-pyruvate transaminase